MSWPFFNFNDDCEKEPKEGECCSYEGPTLPATGIKDGDCFSVAMQKIDAVLWGYVGPTTTTTTTTVLVCNLEGMATELDCNSTTTTSTTLTP